MEFFILERYKLCGGRSNQICTSLTGNIITISCSHVKDRVSWLWAETRGLVDHVCLSPPLYIGEKEKSGALFRKSSK